MKDNDNDVDAEIDAILAVLGPVQRGFVLGLLLSRESNRREPIAGLLHGNDAWLCQRAVRAANALHRDGRLQLIHRVAAEALGVGERDGRSDAGSIERLQTALLGESSSPSSPCSPTLRNRGPSPRRPRPCCARARVRRRNAPRESPPPRAMT